MLHLALLLDFKKINNIEMKFEISDNIYNPTPQVTKFHFENTFLNEQSLHPCPNQVTRQI